MLQDVTRMYGICVELTYIYIYFNLHDLILANLLDLFYNPILYSRIHKYFYKSD